MAPKIDNTTSCINKDSPSERYKCEANKIEQVIQDNPPQTEPELSLADTTKALSNIFQGTCHLSFQSGHEPELLNWALSQPDHSLGISALFSEAYMNPNICDQELRCALVTTHNIVEQSVRTPERNTVPIRSKMMIYRPEDPTGADYHFTGSALFTYLSSQSFGALATAAQQLSRFSFHDIDYSYDPVMQKQYATEEPSLDFGEFKVDWRGYFLGAALLANKIPS